MLLRPITPNRPSTRDRQLVLRSVFSRRAAAGAAEGFVEAADRVEAGAEGHIHDLFVRRREQSARVRNPVMRQIIDQRRAKGFFEKAHRVVRMQADGLADVVYGQWL